MAQNFIRPDRDQVFLMPVDMREWLPEDDLAWVVLDAVDQCDLSGFTGAYRVDGQGRAAFDPAMMVALLLYGYCHGVRSSREIERRCVRDVAFRVLAGGLRPDHATIARFRARHEAGLQSLFTEILRLCAQAGMVRLAVLAIDGTKVGADASWSANRTVEQLEAELAEAELAEAELAEAELAEASARMLADAAGVDAAEDQQFGPYRGDELPELLRTRTGRLARLAEARGRLVAERQARLDAHQAKIDAWQARRAAGLRGGRKPGPTPPSGSRNSGSPLRANSTDPQARTVRSKNTMIVGYNAQAVVTLDQVIVGATVMQKEVDYTLLHDVLDTARCQMRSAGLTPRLRTVVADSGYVSEAVFTKAHTDKIRLLAPLSKDTRLMRDGGDPAAGEDLTRRPETARGQRRLRHWRGRADYKQRGRTIEPVFGQLKTRQNMTRFSRRGITAVTSEWHLAAAAHNLLKLHKHQTS